MMSDGRLDHVLRAGPNEAAVGDPDSGSRQSPSRVEKEHARIGLFPTAGAARTEALLRITAAIADAVADTEVFEALVDQVAETLEASSAGLWIVDDAVAGARLMRSRGYPEAAQSHLAVLPLDGAPSPALDTIRTGEAMWFASQSAMYARYPHLAPFAAASPRSYRLACLPLATNGRTLGVLAFTIEEAGEVSAEEREFLLLVARYATQALERLRLFKETLAAQERAEQSLAEQKRDEAVLRRSEQEFRTLADNIPAMVARFDTALRHVYVNRQVEIATGIPAAAFIGKTNREMGVSDELCGPGDAQLRQVFETASSTILEFTLPSPAGARTCQAWFGPEFGPNGTVETALCITRDVTEQKELENELRRRMSELAEADRRKDDFLATLAHELRNPLAPIRNATQVLKLKAPSDPKLTGSLDVIDRQVRHMARMLEDLLDVSRISRDKLELRREAVAIHDVIEAAVETSRPILDAQRHELRVNVPQQPIWVDADPVRLAQVFSNLLNNAAKYTPSGGRIVVNVEAEPNAVSVSVKDNGIGIEPEVLSKIFDIFTQAGAALGRSQGGIGIGLSLVKGLVTLHGGTVRATSEGIHRGSEFVVELPTMPMPRPEPQEPKGVAEGPHRYRVLVVDDNADSAETIAMLLEMLGSEVKTATDGEAALRIAEAFGPNVVLLDLGMPVMDGFEVCRGLRREPWGRDIFVVAMTGWGGDENRRRTRDAGFDAHLVKPVDSAALMKLLAEHVRPA